MDDLIFYSIIVVCLNPGERLLETIDSISAQQYGNFEVIIKDGGSSDGSIDTLKKKLQDGTAYADSRIHIYTQPDTGIYDAMNQAICYAKGDYLLFLNTGDTLYDREVLNKITNGIIELSQKNGQKPDIVYGNLYHKALQSVVYASPQINDFTCYRNVPCHQTCFYHRDLFLERGYEPRFNVRADYEHFLWCYYEKKARICYVPVMTAAYEGGGYSETPENRKRSARQHREITQHYMGRGKAWKYRMILLLSLAPLRTKLAESERFATCYNTVKRAIYKLRK